MQPLLRIGALAQRTGVTTHVLRVWEVRYRLVTPRRSPGGYRLYGSDDEARVRRMVALRAEGHPAAEAARRVLGEQVSAPDLDVALERITAAVERHDDAAFHEVLDTALVGHAVEDVLTGLVFPFLRRLGDDWEAGRVTVAVEHYASGLVRGRMAALDPVIRIPAPRSSGSSGRRGPVHRAVLACTPRERHDIGLLGLDLVLRRQGWHTVFLGADTPVEDSITTARGVGAGVLVLCGTEPQLFAAHVEQHAEELRELHRTCRVALGGPAASAGLGELVGLPCLTLDPVRAAAELGARLVPA